MRFERQPSTSIKCVFSSVLMDYRKRNIRAVRDFPMRSSQHGIAVADTLNGVLEAGDIGFRLVA